MTSPRFVTTIADTRVRITPHDLKEIYKPFYTTKTIMGKAPASGSAARLSAYIMGESGAK